MPQLRVSVPDGGVVALKNANVAALPAKRLLKYNTTAEQCDLATAVGDKAAGISMAGGIGIGLFGDVQQKGRGIVTAGAAVAVGDRITTDANGKGVAAAPAGGTNNAVWGIAQSAASGIDVDFEIELFGAGLAFQG